MTTNQRYVRYVIHFSTWRQKVCVSELVRHMFFIRPPYFGFYIAMKFVVIKKSCYSAAQDISQISSLPPRSMHPLEGDKIINTWSKMPIKRKFWHNLVVLLFSAAYQCDSYGTRSDVHHTCSCISWRCWWSRSQPLHSLDWSQPEQRRNIRETILILSAHTWIRVTSCS